MIESDKWNNWPVISFAQTDLFQDLCKFVGLTVNMRCLLKKSYRSAKVYFGSYISIDMKITSWC